MDGVTVEELEGYMADEWDDIKERIRERSYTPLPVRRVKIPKPDGSKRNLGIPTVMDRVIQQAMAQVISPMCEPYFSDHSYGFRPNRSCEGAVRELLGYINDGCTWIVDFDLEKFFDKVPQDKLCSFVHDIVDDGDTESLTRKYLQAGVMDDGVFQAVTEGTPQGGNLSPLLANIFLDRLDREAEARGLRFVRYADDFVVAVKSRTSAVRVMHSLTEWIERRLGMKVNATKTQVKTPSQVKFLGFGFWHDNRAGRWLTRPHQDSVARFRRGLKKLTGRSNGLTMDERIRRLNRLIRGWINYFAMASMKSAMAETDAHLRTRMRVIIWKQWKVPSKRQWGLQKLGIGRDLARCTSYCGDRYLWIATKTCLSRAVSKASLIKRGLVSCEDYYAERHALKCC